MRFSSSGPTITKQADHSFLQMDMPLIPIETQLNLKRMYIKKRPAWLKMSFVNNDIGHDFANRVLGTNNLKLRTSLH